MRSIRSAQKFSAFYKLNVHFRFSNSHQPSLASAKCIQSNLQFISTICLRLLLILSSSLRLHIPRCLLHSVFFRQISACNSSSQLCYMPHLSHPPWFHRPNRPSVWLRFLIMQLPRASSYALALRSKSPLALKHH
jgi:hypothetical protein